MRFVHHHSYEKGAMGVARALLALQFAIAAYYKTVGFAGEVAMTAAAGVPFASAAVGAALIFEIAAVISLLSGYALRQVSFLLALYVMLLAALFYNDWSNQMIFGLFVSHLGLAAALFVVSGTAGGTKHNHHHH